MEIIDRTSKRKGFTILEIMIAVTIIGLLAAIAIPNFVRARKSAQAKACVNNLRLIDSAAQQYMLENVSAAAVTFADCLPYLGRGAGALPVCPKAGTYSVAAATPAACTIGATEGVGFEHQLP